MFVKNEGKLDRGIRIILGLVLLYVGFGPVLGGIGGIVVGVVGLIALVTGITGWCALYSALGWNTSARAAP